MGMIKFEFALESLPFEIKTPLIKVTMCLINSNSKSLIKNERITPLQSFSDKSNCIKNLWFAAWVEIEYTIGYVNSHLQKINCLLLIFFFHSKC